MRLRVCSCKRFQLTIDVTIDVIMQQRSLVLRCQLAVTRQANEIFCQHRFSVIFNARSYHNADDCRWILDFEHENISVGLKTTFIAGRIISNELWNQFEYSGENTCLKWNRILGWIVDFQKAIRLTFGLVYGKRYESRLDCFTTVELTEIRSRDNSLEYYSIQQQTWWRSQRPGAFLPILK